MVTDVGAIDQPPTAATSNATRTTTSATACWDVTTPSVDGEAAIHRRVGDAVDDTAEHPGEAESDADDRRAVCLDAKSHDQAGEREE